jgi:hypothetical protein
MFHSGTEQRTTTLTIFSASVEEERIVVRSRVAPVVVPDRPPVLHAASPAAQSHKRCAQPAGPIERRRRRAERGAAAAPEAILDRVGDALPPAAIEEVRSGGCVCGRDLAADVPADPWISDNHVAAAAAPVAVSGAGDTRHDVSMQRVRVTLVGSGFLKHMVRRIVGTLAQVGSHARPAGTLAAILAAGALIGPAAPAHGTVLAAFESVG